METSHPQDTASAPTTRDEIIQKILKELEIDVLAWSLACDTTPFAHLADHKTLAIEVPQMIYEILMQILDVNDFSNAPYIKELRRVHQLSHETIKILKTYGTTYVKQVTKLERLVDISNRAIPLYEDMQLEDVTDDMSSMEVT